MNNIVGHEAVKSILNTAVKDNKVGHAYIFEGASGVGRLSLAKAFAEIIAEAPKKLSADENPDIIVVSNEYFGIDKKTLSIDAVRKMKNDIYLRPAISKRKVYIVPNADTMLIPAQNSLLKVFEEPPEYCTVILIAENIKALLITIRSRAVKIHFNPLETEQVKNHLISKGYEEKKAEVAAVMSKGSIGKALLFAEDESFAEIRENVFGYIINLSGSYSKLYEFVKFLRQNKASSELILRLMADWSYDVLRLKLDSKYNVANIDKADEIKKFCSLITVKAAFEFNEIIEKYSRVIKANANYPIAVLCMATEYWEEIHGRNYRSAF